MKKLILIIVSISIFSCSHKPVEVSPEVTHDDVAMDAPVISEGAEDREPASYQSCLEIMSKMMAYQPYYGAAKKVFSTAKSLQELEAAYGNGNLIDIQRNLPNSEILANNANIKELLKQPLVVKPIKGKNAKIGMADANTIYRAMADSGSNKNHYCYDPKGTIGFCFGRATIAHMEAIIREVHPDAVKKIWIAGDMGKWGHHVATMVYTDHGWIVLDTNLGRVADIDTWVATYMPMKAKGAKNDIMIFTTQAGRYGPYDNRPYNAIDLFNTKSEEYNKAKDYFNGYFHDYFESLDNVKTPPLMH